MPLSVVQGTNDLATCHIESGEKRSSSVADIIVTLTRWYAGAKWQDRPGSIQRLNLALLVHAEHKSALRRIQIETHNVPDLLDKERIGGKFEAFHPMRLQRERPPNPRYCGLR